MKDPLNNMGFALKKAVERMQPKSLNLAQDVHPTLGVSINYTRHEMLSAQ